MHLVRDRLSALKSWIFTDNYVLCLGAGITTESDSVVTTAIEQRLKKADLMELKSSRWNMVENSVLSDVKDARFFHDKTGYIILQAEEVFINDESRTGSWHDIMGTYPASMMDTKDVISLWINHGNKPHDASYQYLVLPATTSQKVASFDLKEIEIFSNTQELQAVYLPKEKTIFIAAFSPIAKKLPLNIDFKCSQPGLYMIKYKSAKEQPEVIYNDPTQLLESAEYEINGKRTHINLELSN
jgi:chondroitin AC lyase